MDIQKEREAFETWYRKNYDNSVIDDSEFSEILDEYESNYYWVDELNHSWKAWQAAKAHEAEKLKGKVVVPVKPTEHMLNEGYKTYSQVGSLSIVYKAMLEAARSGNE